eukprot:scaffold25642_cov73-Attheya_sp.AAC.5
MNKCPICGLELIRQRLQFRQDDEPATLVVSCPDHGAAADVVLKYRLRSTETTSYDRCIRSSTVEFETRVYGVYNNSEVQDGVSLQYTIRVDDPIWSVDSPIVACNIQPLSIVEDHCLYYTATVSTLNECGKESSLNSYSMQYKQLYDAKYKTRVIIVQLGGINRYRLWFQISNDVPGDHIRNHLTHCASRILTIGCMKDSRILHKDSVQSWTRSVLRYSTRDSVIPQQLVDNRAR